MRTFVIVGVVLAIAGAAVPGHSALAASLDLRGADAWAAAPPSEGRERALKQWAEHARLSDLLYVLRRSPAELRSLEALMARAALKQTPATRPALRRRLLARVLLADPKAKVSRDDLQFLISDPPRFPRASVFRVAAFLPDSGDYRDYGRSVLQGIQAGLAEPASPAAPLLELRVLSTGDDRVGLAVARLDTAASVAGVAIGELLSTPTLALAAASRMAGMVLISPTATDEGIGAVGPAVFQVGPSGYERGIALARAVLGSGSPRRIGVLLSSALDPSPFARGFAAAARELKSTVVWKTAYAAGSTNFRDEVRAMTAQRVELLFWDGDPREAEALVRQLARERVSVQICGGGVLAPDQYHVETRSLLEGVLYVGDDWRLASGARARLDSLLSAQGQGPATSLHVRGFLAGRMVRAAVSQGALCPEEVAAQLQARLTPERELRTLGFVDLRAEGAEIEVHTVKRGRGVVATAP
jgi:ABC-type branched-subunit amino acid transport system substrate-binding protein